MDALMNGLLDKWTNLTMEYNRIINTQICELIIKKQKYQNEINQYFLAMCHKKIEGLERAVFATTIPVNKNKGNQSQQKSQIQNVAMNKQNKINVTQVNQNNIQLLSKGRKELLSFLEATRVVQQQLEHEQRMFSQIDHQWGNTRRHLECIKEDLFSQQKNNTK